MVGTPAMASALKSIGCSAAVFTEAVLGTLGSPCSRSLDANVVSFEAFCRIWDHRTAGGAESESGAVSLPQLAAAQPQTAHQALDLRVEPGDSRAADLAGAHAALAEEEASAEAWKIFAQLDAGGRGTVGRAEVRAQLGAELDEAVCRGRLLGLHSLLLRCVWSFRHQSPEKD